MRKLWILIGLVGMVAACDKHDPILPGVRSDVFMGTDLHVLNTEVPNVPENITDSATNDCPYVQKNDNTIWNGDRKIFSGFATNNSVSGTRTPVCHNGFVYAGLSTGELVKLNPKTRQIAWVADIYRPSNMTGGASMVDIIVPAHICGDAVYVGGMGNAFCRISDKTGVAKWCADIGVATNFIIADDTAYVLDTDKYLNAVRLTDGAIYWRTLVDDTRAPKYQDKMIIIGSQKISAENGKISE
ncbi:MAG: PQQ-binding-like beta-propeller repeat protein [Alphaproteobacteria bacterium]|nr:PQQ-binding-like beta-propeller repeat protein [Alphaproteobacteria bacterium]